MDGLGFKLYLVFVVSWFLQMPGRIPALGAIRADLLLMLLLTAISIKMALGSEKKLAPGNSDPAKPLRILLIYVVLTLPLVEWPGSVINSGFELFFKAVVFYIFTVSFVRDEKRLKTFMIVFVGCQAFRVLEPVYLHVTEGYWGSIASMADWQYMERLSGAPHDVINPNGLAFVILTVLPFAHYLGLLSRFGKALYLGVLPVLLYALVLTGSRTGMLGLVAVLGVMFVKSKKKVGGLVLAGIGLVLILPLLSADQRDRYESLFDSSSANAGTVTGRIEGLKSDIHVALRRPFFGHGLGTSAEANANFGDTDHRAHNLYTEVFQELGFVGLIIFLFFLRATVVNFLAYMKERESYTSSKSQFLWALGAAGEVWLAMNLLFSLASYGLLSYEWYMLAGLSVVLRRLSAADQAQRDAARSPLAVARVAAPQSILHGR